MPKNLTRNLVLILAIGVSGCNSSEAQVEDQVVETIVEANSTTSTTLDPRKIAANKLASWTWQPSIEDTLRKLNLAQFDKFFPRNLTYLPFEEWLIGQSSLGCAPLFSLSNLMSVDGINLPQGSGAMSANSGNYLVVAAFLADVGSDNEVGLASRYDKILASKGDYCSGDEYVSIDSDLFFKEAEDCRKIILVPQFLESRTYKQPGAHESKLSWLGTEYPSYEEILEDDVALATTSVMREGFIKQSSTNQGAVFQEYLIFIAPIGYSLFIRTFFIVSKNMHNFNFNESMNIVEEIGPLVAKRALEDIKFKINN